jgi:NitT/TauT family transport system permease protein
MTVLRAARRPRLSAGSWRIMRPVLLPLLLGALLVAAWDLSVSGFRLSPVVLPRPGAVLQVLAAHLPLLREHAGYTAIEIAGGLALSIVVGFSLGVLLSGSRAMRSALMPNLVAFELVPKIAMAPLFIIWLGTGSESRLVFALFLAFFPILISSVSGLTRTDPALLRLCSALKASPWQTFATVRLPFALPFIFSGIKIGATMAVIGVVVGEFITGNRGLGYIIMFAASNMETALMLAAMALLCVLGSAFYGAVVLMEWLVDRRYGRPQGRA